jgi:lipopolysaccharide/colanic/teichoic acid biosynthesis glycosyltransferase
MATSTTIQLTDAVIDLRDRQEPQSTTTPKRAGRRLVDNVLRRADAGFDAVATLLALAVIGEVDRLAAVLVLLAHLVLSVSRNQPPPFRLEQYLQFGRIASATLIVVLASMVSPELPATQLAAIAAATAAFCVTGRTGHVALLRWARRSGYLSERALVVGNALERHGLRQACGQRQEYGIEVIGDLEPRDLDSITASPDVDGGASALVIARGVRLTDQVLGDLRWAVTRGYRVLIETSRTDQLVPAGEVVDLANARVVCLPFAPLSYRSWLLKRAFDLAVSLTLLVALAPVMAVAAIGVRLSSPGPTIFRQPRIGRDGRTFTMYKFRTFPVDHVDDAFSLDHQDCPLRFGRFLRRTSLDELPQLVNVLRGQMSIVGPRPERPHFAGDLAASIPGYHERHRVPGGITGLAQVNGFWGNSDIFERVMHDNAYIDSWRLRRDFGILLRTIPATIRKGRSAARSAEAAQPQRQLAS